MNNKILLELNENYEKIYQTIEDIINFYQENETRNILVEIVEKDYFINILETCEMGKSYYEFIGLSAENRIFVPKDKFDILSFTMQMMTELGNQYETLNSFYEYMTKSRLNEQIKSYKEHEINNIKLLLKEINITLLDITKEIRESIRVGAL